MEGFKVEGQSPIDLVDLLIMVKVPTDGANERVVKPFTK